MLQGNNMDARKMAYLELFLLAGILILGVDSQECSDLQSSVQPCMMVIMNEFSSMGKSSGQSPSLGIMTIFCKPEVKTAMVCIFEAVKACPEIAPSLSSIPGMINMDSNTLDSMCSAMMDFSSQEVCLTSALNSTRYISCLTSTVDMSEQDPCIMYRATAICSLRILQQECPSVVAAYNYSLKFSKPSTCPDVVITDDEGMDGQCTRNDTDRYAQCATRALMGLSQLSNNVPGMESLTGVLNYICGSAKIDVTCFLEGYEKCPKFKMNSDKTGLTTMFQPKPLKDLVMTGCKNINELGKHSECMHEQFQSTEFQKCVETASKTYPGPNSPSEPMSCNLYNAMKTCLHDSVGENCDNDVAEYLAKWSSIIFKTNEDCTTAGAPMSLSSVFLMLALFATVFIL